MPPFNAAGISPTSIPEPPADFTPSPPRSITNMDLERRAFDLPYAPKAEVGTIITWTEAAVALILIGLRIYGWSIGVLRLRTDFWIVMVTLVSLSRDG